MMPVMQLQEAACYCRGSA